MRRPDLRIVPKPVSPEAEALGVEIARILIRAELEAMRRERAAENATTPTHIRAARDAA